MGAADATLSCGCELIVIKFLKLFFLTALLVGGAVLVRAQDASPDASGLATNSLRYQLGSGDQIRVTVYGEEDLSGEFELDGEGTISLPLIGAITVGNRSLSDAESLITAQLADGFLVNPRVNIEVLNYRPFYILGEVQDPGSYPYVSGMTVLNAVALASGFTYRASESKIEVTRRVDGVEQKMRIELTAAVLPGDIIRVPERFF